MKYGEKRREKADKESTEMLMLPSSLLSDKRQLSQFGPGSG